MYDTFREGKRSAIGNEKLMPLKRNRVSSFGVGSIADGALTVCVIGLSGTLLENFIGLEGGGMSIEGSVGAAAAVDAFAYGFLSTVFVVDCTVLA